MAEPRVLLGKQGHQRQQVSRWGVGRGRVSRGRVSRGRVGKGRVSRIKIPISQDSFFIP